MGGLLPFAILEGTLVSSDTPHKLTVKKDNCVLVIVAPESGYSKNIHVAVVSRTSKSGTYYIYNITTSTTQYFKISEDGTYIDFPVNGYRHISILGLQKTSIESFVSY